MYAALVGIKEIFQKHLKILPTPNIWTVAYNVIFLRST